MMTERDGDIDCEDPDCVGEIVCQEDCANGIDDDGDGDIDCEDPDCVGEIVCQEDCANGIDDDGDGDIDCEDPDCAGDPACGLAVLLGLKGQAASIVRRHGFAEWSGSSLVDDCIRLDLDGDGTIGISDLVVVLAAWGSDPRHPSHTNHDGFVGHGDLLNLVANWGPCK
jgi:hypothetical protein